MARNLTDKAVAALKPREKQYTHADPQLPGHYIRVSPGGNKSFVAVARDPRGKQIWTTIGSTALLDIEAARAKARTVMLAVKGGKSADGPDSFEAVAKGWMQRHVEAKGLRSDYEINRLLNKHLLPAWGGREFESIKRGDIAKLLDKVEDESGPRTADYTLSVISGIANWYAKRHDDYVSPVIRGMKRHSSKDNARTRILSDDEIRRVWNAADNDVVKLLLLTAQRREKVATMRWEDVSIDGVWNVPNGSRQKGTGGELPLSDMAIEIIRSRPRIASNPYVFPGHAGSHAKPKQFIAKLDMPHWQLHDLRRTARSLMSRAGVSPHIAERVLGHVIPGVEGIYDRHAYREEKAHALKALASLIGSILNPAADNVVALRG